MKRIAPAAERNKEPILAAIGGRLPARGRVLEIACGSGQHAVHVAGALPHLTWMPTDADPSAVASTEAWRADAGLANLEQARLLDVTTWPWPVTAADAIVCINMIHIAPWPVAVALMAGAGRVLSPGAPLITYGPYRFAGRFTAPSNAAFDADLRARDPSWGVRDVRDLSAAAVEHGLALASILALPANNHVLVWRRR